jgi:predicted secreted hydrolase
MIRTTKVRATARRASSAVLALVAGLVLDVSASNAHAGNGTDATEDGAFDDAQCQDTLAGPINLPADDAIHPYSAYSDEWYYYSTHLVTDDGREFGFAQIVYTLLSPDSGTPIQFVDSTITDVAGGKYHFGGRQYSFDAPSVIPNAFDFQIGTERVRGGGGHDVVHSVVSDGAATYVVDLELESLKAPILHIADGYVNYYSRERMRARGTISVNGNIQRVHGTTWFDHQFGPQLIELSTVKNWTWIGAQLTQGRELFALVVNRQDGTEAVFGSYTDEHCHTTQLGPGDFTLTALGSFAPSASCSYPFGWNVKVPSKNLDLEVEPMVQNQDILVPGQDHYYEGDSRVTGTSRGRAYVELYGFCAPSL